MSTTKPDQHRRAAVSARLRPITGRTAESRRWADTWHHHRLRQADWWAMWNGQDGRCYLCGEPLPTQFYKVHVDHDHSCCRKPYTCAFCRRGLSCGTCNVIIGMAGEDTLKLRRIADRLDAAVVLSRARLASKPRQMTLGGDEAANVPVHAGD